MTAQPEHPAAPSRAGAIGDDPTRDIRLPPGGAVLPAAWSRPPAEPAPSAQERQETPEPPSVDQRTDELAPPPRQRNRTLAFTAPEMRHRPIEPVQVGRSPRRWPWLVLAALPLLIIVGTGIWLLLLLRGA